MGRVYNREIEKLKNEKKASAIKLNADKELFARQLENGLGEEIKKELRHPRKPNRWLGFKIKFAKLMKIFKERITSLEIK